MTSAANLTVVLHGATSRSGPSVSLVTREDETLGELLARAAPALGIEGDLLRGAGYVISTEDGAWFSEGTQRWGETMARVIEGAGGRELFVYPRVVCMHGSPGVLGRGHLCGWC